MMSSASQETPRGEGGCVLDECSQSPTAIIIDEPNHASCLPAHSGIAADHPAGPPVGPSSSTLETYHTAPVVMPEEPYVPRVATSSPPPLHLPTDSREDPPQLPDQRLASTPSLAALALPLQRQRQRPATRTGRLLTFFGYGRNNKARKILISFIWTMSLDTVEV